MQRREQKARASKQEQQDQSHSLRLTQPLTKIHSLPAIPIPTPPHLSSYLLSAFSPLFLGVHNSHASDTGIFQISQLNSLTALQVKVNPSLTRLGPYAAQLDAYSHGKAESVEKDLPREPKSFPRVHRLKHCCYASSDGGGILILGSPSFPPEALHPILAADKLSTPRGSRNFAAYGCTVRIAWRKRFCILYSHAMP